MAHYLDPKNDLTFKRIFGEHENLCMSLLNSMLPLEDRQIVSLKYQSSELTPEISILKDSLVDVCCTDNLGRQFLVEMQMQWTNSFQRRVLFNASKAYVKQLGAGQSYRLIQPVYALNFVNDIFDPDQNVYYHDYKIVNVENVEKQIEGLELVFIELPKFRPANRAEKKLYDLWLTFLSKIKDGAQTVPDELMQEEVTREAVQYLEQHSYTKDELLAYEEYRDAILVQRAFIEDAEEKGETKKLIETVIAGYQNGFSIEQIQVYSKLDRKQIEEILKSNNIKK